MGGPVSINPPSSISISCPVPFFGVRQLGNLLGATLDSCETQYNLTDGSSATAYQLIVPQATWNQLAAGSNGFLPAVAAGGFGSIVLDGTEITIGALAGPELLITVGVATAGVMLYQYLQSEKPTTIEIDDCLLAYNKERQACAEQYASDPAAFIKCMRRAELNYDRCKGGQAPVPIRPGPGGKR